MNKSYHLLTFGCQMNVSDSERIDAKLKELGYLPASEQEAGLVIVNACSVRQHAVDRIWGKLKRWAMLGKKQIVVTGCILKEDKIKFEVRGVKTFKITELKNLGKILKSDIDKQDTDSLEYFDILPEHSGKVAYISIGTGCNNFCSYCAVPYTRGREVSRPMDDIIAETKIAVDNGFKQIMLLGQNVNSYGIPSSKSKCQITNNNERFIKLLKSIDNLPGEFTFDFMSSNPQDMGDDLIKCFAGLKKWSKELHFAMQSGDDEILKKMNRKATSSQFLALITKLKAQISNIKISTDILVGYPGETIAQFNNTVKICKKIGFYKAYIFKYSPRPGTPAAKLVDDVTDDEKKRRYVVLNDLINK